MKTLAAALILPVLAIVAVYTGWSAESSVSSAPLERAGELLTGNKPADALAVLSNYTPPREEFSAYHRVYARALVTLERHYESLEHYRFAFVYAARAADKEGLLLERADVLFAMKYYSEAAVYFELFLKQFPKSSFTERAEFGIAECRFRSNEFRRALSHYEKAGTSARAVIGKANALQALGRTAEAHELYEAMIEHYPGIVESSPETVYLVGENYRQTGKLGEARLFFESIRAPALRYRVALGLGLVFLAEKKFDVALDSFKTAEGSPERPFREEALMHRAEALLQLGNNASAEEALTELRTVYPYGKKADAAALMLAKLRRKEGKTTEAFALLKTLIYRRSPDGAALDEVEAMLLEAKDRDPEELVKLWATAGPWLLDPSRTNAVVKIAPDLRRTGKPFLDVCAWLIKYGSEEAKAAAWLMLADFRADLGDESTALFYIKRAKVSGHSDDAARIMAKVHLARGEARKASEAILTVRGIRETDLLLLIEAMQKDKHNGRTVAFLEQALRKTALSASTSVRAADMLYVNGKPKQALAHYRAAAAAGPASRDERTAADVEWAHYRISLIAGGAEGAESLKAIRAAKNAVGRLAAAELKGAELKGKMQ